MESVLAASREKKQAMQEVEIHIHQMKKYLRVFESVDQPALYQYVLEPASEETVATRSAGRTRIATLLVDCEECKGGEVMVLGIEHEKIRKNRERFYCEHGNLITNLSLRPTNYEAARPLKSMYLKKTEEEHPTGHQSSVSTVQ